MSIEVDDEMHENEENALEIGSILKEDFKIISVLGAGGFGITYKAKDIELDITVAIKEYIPSQFASRSYQQNTITCSARKQEIYKSGLDAFLEEARTITKLEHVNIVKTSRFFRANNTAYFVMDFYDGQTLKDYLEDNKEHKFTQDEIISVMMPILEGLKVVHQAGLLHRDISPDNIFMPIDRSPILIDFGASRNILGTVSQNISAIIKIGYSPQEQYSLSSSKQNETTDLYAISSVMFHLITGVRPPESTHRQSELFDDKPDPMEDITQNSNYQLRFTKSFLETVAKGLSIKQKDRIKTIKEYQSGLMAEKEILPTPSSLPVGFIIFTLVLVIIIIEIIFFINLESKIKSNPIPKYEEVEVVEESILILTKDEELQEDCDAGDMTKCTTLGVMYSKGQGVTQDKIRAVKLYEQACNSNNTNGCFNLGYMYENGQGIGQDEIKAIQLYQKACDGNHTKGCLNLGLMYENGIGIIQDKIKATQLYQKACDGDDINGCFNLGYMYDKGEGVTHDKNKAIKFYTKACDAGSDTGCFNLKIYKKYTLTINTIPSDAKVYIMNISEKYKDEIKLKGGIYMIKVKKNGYITKFYDVDLDSDFEKDIELTKIIN